MVAFMYYIFKFYGFYNEESCIKFSTLRNKTKIFNEFLTTK